MDKQNSRSVFIKTYGCQMNSYDSERMSNVLAAEGYAAASSPEEADLVILNTCHIREHASEKIFSEVGKLKVLKDERAHQGRPMRIAVAGCVAQAEGAEIIRRARAVDLVFGPQSYHRLPNLLARADSGERGIVETEFPVEEKFASLPSPSQSGPVTAFLTIQEGCDKFCSFCVVPYTRGAEYSRPAAEILTELRKLLDRGAREITLLGQNVNAWMGEGLNGSKWNFAELLESLSQEERLFRLRYTTSHPNDMNDDLISLHATNSKLMPYLHLPVQSGSDRVLRAMNRKHTAQQYIDLIAKVRAARADIAISGDFIVGFPDESETEFQETLQLVKEIQYASAFTFAYSSRPGTPAANHQAQISDEIKKQRLHALQALILEQTASFNSKCLGRKLSVLAEKPGRYEGQLIGRSPYLQSVHFEAPLEKIGQICEIEIEAVGPNSLSGYYGGN